MTRQTDRARVWLFAPFVVLLLPLLGACAVSTPDTPDMIAPPGKNAADRLYDRTACSAGAQTRERSRALHSDAAALSNAFDSAPSTTLATLHGTADGFDPSGNGAGGAPHSLIGHALYDQDYTECMIRRGYRPREESQFGTGPLVASGGHGSDTATLTDAAGPWTALVLRDLDGTRVRGDIPGQASTGLWKQEIARTAQTNLGHKPGLTVLSALLQDGPTYYLLSMAFLPEPICDNGGADAAPGREYAVCPARVAVIVDHVARAHAVGKLCADMLNWHLRPGDRNWRDPARWGTRARLDASRHLIELQTLQDGKPVAVCDQDVQLQ
ncbi:hypothetical protein AA103196_0688 [Ameyamaea chiangmaiensis NBRC 103196]|uniref:Lipoprotein n=1 Tax=Ameyamaea chiangmaiensis TaxID=442969 RepID=A0A850P9Z6_9PROT|nr:hypothetical protein [Ameyamaea chiangmaiensis]MBS4075791.1 hypothetical protein [Ameyamaea chiangmaiensis]NVN40854.1 hypothetical protein [Ameyamaea chiangmaiensis]GBQ63758.1 hypothetical protein AA103196_0688 [Ameyamaea chiangmaiensis NBRC 103196]